MRTRTALLTELHELDGDDATRSGRKAATLGRLARAGIAVPEGLVLSTEALDRMLADTPAGCATTEHLLTAELPPDVRVAVGEIAEHFGDAVLAVRSSAVAEDLPQASYAGQYETVLNVRGADALHRAVRRCWASVDSDRLRAYGHGAAAEAPALAVLVQRQVDADVAGVAFTRDPVSGATDRVLVSAAPGLGDAVVGGTVDPDEWVVTGQSAVAARVTHQALTETQACTVAALARRVESILQGPQDLEWAMAGGRLVVLQARPITALPKPPTTQLPAGSWVKESGHYAEPFHAFAASLAAAAVSEGLSSMFATYGSLVDRIETQMVGGEPYARVVPVGGHEGAPPPWWALAVLARVVPALRRRVRTAARSARPEVLEAQLDRWEREWRPGLQAEIAALRTVDLATLDDPQVGAHLGASVDLARRALHLHFQLIPPYAVPVHQLIVTCSRLLGWGEAESLDLLTGCSPASSSPSRALSELATRVRRRPTALAVVLRGGPGLAEELAKADAGLGAAYRAWCDEYGFRCVHDDPGSATLLERPGLLAKLLRDAVSDTDGKDVEAPGRAAVAVERARAGLAGRRQADREAFEQALAAATRAYPLREDSAFWTSSVPGALVRSAAIEGGRRLAAGGVLTDPEDVVHLDAQVVQEALAGHAPGDLRALAGSNRAERNWVRTHPGPAYHGPAPADPPDVRGLPGPARRLNAALLWAQGAGQSPARSERPDDRDLHGAAGSPGRYTGPVRIVREVHDFDRLQPGEVLVCYTTDPAWSVLFGIAGAVITDAGGILSHGAIVAREHGLPAVLGTGEATRTLHDGDLVTVDGTAGRVVLEVERVTTSPKEKP